MKPNLTRSLKTDHNYTAATLAEFNSRCANRDANARSFRKISDNYFKYEAPHNFAGEAALFALIAVTAALPILNNASALAHFIRAISGV